MPVNFSTNASPFFNLSANDTWPEDMQSQYCSQENGLCSQLRQSFDNPPPDSVYADLSTYNNLTWLWLCVAFFTPLCLFGIVGNITTIVLFTKYIKQTTTSIFIIALAIVDLTICAIPIPIWIYKLFHYRIASDIICKLDFFLLNLAPPMSVLILLVIAIDRFLLIFLARMDVMTPFRAKVIIAAVTVLCVALATPQLLVYTTIHKVVEAPVCPNDIYCNLELCRDTDSIVSRPTLVQLRDVSLAIFFLTSLVILVMYSLIFVKVYRMYKTMLRWRNTSSAGSNCNSNGDSTKKLEVEKDHLTFASAADDQNNTTIATGNTATPNPGQLTTSKEENNGNEQQNLVNCKSPKKKPSSSKKKLPHLRTAVTLLLVTATFIFTYGSLYVINIIVLATPKSEDGLSLELKRNSARYFFHFFYYLNHIANPIIYTFMNPRFKEVLKSLLRKLCVCCRQDHS